MDWINFLIERKSGKTGEGCLRLHPMACVVEYSMNSNGYWRVDTGEALTSQTLTGKVGFELLIGPDGAPYPKRGYHVFVDGIEFIDLASMRTFYADRMRDPIVLEVWPDDSEAQQKWFENRPKPWDRYLSIQEGK